MADQKEMRKIRKKFPLPATSHPAGSGVTSWRKSNFLHFFFHPPTHPPAHPPSGATLPRPIIPTFIGHYPWATANTWLWRHFARRRDYHLWSCSVNGMVNVIGLLSGRTNQISSPSEVAGCPIRAEYQRNGNVQKITMFHLMPRLIRAAH